MNFSFKCFLSNVGEVNLLLFFKKKGSKFTSPTFESTLLFNGKKSIKMRCYLRKKIVMWVGEYERIINFEQLSHTILLFPFVTWNN